MAVSLAVAAGLRGQVEGDPVVPTPVVPVSVTVYSFEHQSASEALGFVLPLLTERGAVELRPGENALVVRDTPAALSRILPLIRSFDHPARKVTVSVWLVRARSVNRVSGAPEPPPSEVPPELLDRLRQHLPYESYELMAESEVVGREGQEVTFELGDGYTVGFRLGTILAEQRVRLHRFEVSRTESARKDSLMRSNLNLWLDRTMILAMASGETSARALMVVLRCQTGPEP